MEASKRLVNLHIDFDRNGAVVKQFGVRGIPAMFFLDSTGKQLEKWTSRDAGQIAARMKEVADQYTTASKGKSSGGDAPDKKSPFGKPKDESAEDAPLAISWAKNLEAALATGKKDHKAVVLVVANDDDPLLAALQMKKLKPEIEKLVFVKARFDAESDLCKSLEIRKDTTLLVIDPFEKSAKQGTLARLLGARTTAELKDSLKPFAPGRFTCAECKRTAFRAGKCCDQELTEKKD